MPNPPLKMTNTRIELHAGKIARLTDVSDLAELLFPSNRNQQHAFLVVWFSLKSRTDNLVPNLIDATRAHGVSRRTLERVRAKMRRSGLIDRISRFNRRYDGREGWVLSPRFERCLRQLADKAVAFNDIADARREKDQLLVDLAAARRDNAPPSDTTNRLKLKGGETYNETGNIH